MENLSKALNSEYKLIPLNEITDEARKIAVLWGDEYFPGHALPEKHKLASDIMNYAKRFADQQAKKEAIAFQNEIERLKGVTRTLWNVWNSQYAIMLKWSDEYVEELWQDFKKHNNL